MQMLGDLPHACQVAEQAQGLAERRAEADPSSAQAQRDISVSLNYVDQIQAAQGDASAALKSYQQSLLIAEALALADPSNAQAQRDVSYDQQFWENDRNAEFGECHAVEYDA